MAHSQVEPWNEPPLTWADLAWRRAAKWLWAVAAAEFLLAGCCSMMFTRLASMSPGQIEALMAEGGASQQQLAMVMQARTYAQAMATAYGLMGGVPAIVLAATALGVYAGRRWAVNVSAAIVLMQLIVSGAFLLVVIAVAFSSGQPAQFTFGVIVLGSFIAVLFYTLKQLLTARRLGEGDDQPMD